MINCTDLDNCLDDLTTAYDFCREMGAVTAEDILVLREIEPPGTSVARGLALALNDIGRTRFLILATAVGMLVPLAALDSPAIDWFAAARQLASEH